METVGRFQESDRRDKVLGLGVFHVRVHVTSNTAADRVPEALTPGVTASQDPKSLRIKAITWWPRQL